MRLMYVPGSLQLTVISFIRTAKEYFTYQNSHRNGTYLFIQLVNSLIKKIDLKNFLVEKMDVMKYLVKD